MSSRFGLFNTVPLHHSPLLIEAEVPGSTRLLLPVQHGRVGHVIILKHRLLKLALWSEVFLRDRQRNSQKKERVIITRLL